MAEFAAAYVLFILSHAIPARPNVRERLIAVIGERGFIALYSAVSVAMLVWLIGAAARAPYLHLWNMSIWQLWVPVMVMPFVCVFGVFGIAIPNPLSFGGHHSSAFDPHRPGIVGITRHPLLWAIALWGFAHLLPNGNAAHVILFGSSVFFAILGMLVIDRRKRRLLGAVEWSRLSARTSLVPFAAFLRRRPKLRVLRVSLPRLAIAAMLFVTLLAAHRAVIGVSPFPPSG